MDEKTALEFLTVIIKRWRERKPTTTYAIIGALTWLATCEILGKAALLLAIPAFLVFFINVMKEV